MKQRLILVTGGAGHVGSHVIELLLQDKTNRVISLDNYSNGKKRNHFAGADYRSGHTKRIEKIVPETPDFVYHLGEYARISASFPEPARVIDYNLIGTSAVLEFCRTRGVKKLVYAASSTKFADDGTGRDQSPYAFTKATNVDLIKNYGIWYGLKYAICYFYNAYGPREKSGPTYGTVIANFERAYLAGKPMPVVRPGTQQRNFTHVADLARGIILTGEKGNGDGYALNNRKTYSIIEIADAFGGPIELIDGNPGRMDSGESPTKARDELGWETTIDVMDYIEKFKAAHPRRR
jgi:UDP-glucose 4-epimerase